MPRPKRPAIQPTAAWTQMSLTGDADYTRYERDQVLAIDPRQTTNGERVRDLARLGYILTPVLDPTYGFGGMWTHHQPEGLHAGDANPEKVPDLGERFTDSHWIAWSSVLDFTNLPFENRAFPTTLYDPPYRFAGTPTQTDDGDMDDRYGIDVYRTKAELLALIVAGTVECARVTDRYLIVKCQDQVLATETFWQTDYVKAVLSPDEWVLENRLHLISYRAQPDGRTQRNVRNNFSTFLVFGRLT